MYNSEFSLHVLFPVSFNTCFSSQNARKYIKKIILLKIITTNILFTLLETWFLPELEKLKKNTLKYGTVFVGSAVGLIRAFSLFPSKECD